MAQSSSYDTQAAPGLGSAVLMLAVLAGLGLATLVDLIDGPGDARHELVAATPAPPVTLNALRKFPGAARYYVSKRYALKDEFVSLNAEAKLGLFGHSPYARVLQGKDGFWFLGGDAAIDATLGAVPGPQSSDAAWAAHFANLGAAFKARSIPFVFILGPNKHGVYSEALPNWLSAAMPAQSRASQIVAEAAQTLTPAPVDTGRLFAKARVRDSGLMLHHRTDTHWTEAGATLAVNAALAPLALPGLSAPATAMADKIGAAGDLARMIGWQQRLSETVPTLPRASGLRCETPDGAPATILTLDPLPMKRFHCTTPGAAPLRALVFMDSFGMGAVPRLTQLFSDVTFVWQDQVDMSIVDAIKPDVTIQIMVERKLQIADPATLLRP